MPEASNRELFEYLKTLDTEQRNPATRQIDLADAESIARLINDQDKGVADLVELALPDIAIAIELVKDAVASGARLIYMGAGTSGRIGVVDASECPPTFGTEPWQVQGLIAGGPAAMFEAQEGSEDKPGHGEQALRDIDLKPGDVVCGLAASGRTPYVLGGLKYAAEIGCKTVFVCCVAPAKLKLHSTVDVLIAVPVGPEVIMGSTRMKSATAQKMICNMITTGAMVRLGKVYENVMVDLMQTNKKLVERSRRIVMLFSGCSYEEAGLLLDTSDGHVKTALVMALSGVSVSEAKKRLADNEGFVRKALQAR